MKFNPIYSYFILLLDLNYCTLFLSEILCVVLLSSEIGFVFVFCFYLSITTFLYLVVLCKALLIALLLNSAIQINLTYICSFVKLHKMGYSNEV